MQLDVILPAVAGVVTTLVSVGVGATLTRRQQVDAWSRNRQTEVCSLIVRESMRVHHDLLDQVRGRIAKVDWSPWTAALVEIDLVAYPEIVTAAHALDRAIWRVSYAVDGGATEEADWGALRAAMVEARLAFINEARKHLLGSKQPVSQLDGRPPESEWLAAYQRPVLDPPVSGTSD